MWKRLFPIEIRVVVAALVLVVAAVIGFSVARDGDTDRPYINERGIWTPEYFEVRDSTGTAVGVARSAEAFGLDSVRPYPVWSLDDKTRQVGWVRWRGYWPLGEPEPWCRKCKSISTSESIDGRRRVVTEWIGPNYAIIRIHETFDRYGKELSSRAEVVHRPTPTPIPPVAR